MMSFTIFAGILIGFTGLLMKLSTGFLFYSLVIMSFIQLSIAALMFKIMAG